MFRYCHGRLLDFNLGQQCRTLQNPKFETNPKLEIRMTQTHECSGLEFRAFEF